MRGREALGGGARGRALQVGQLLWWRRLWRALPSTAGVGAVAGLPLPLLALQLPTLTLAPFPPWQLPCPPSTLPSATLWSSAARVEAAAVTPLLLLLVMVQ